MKLSCDIVDLQSATLELFISIIYLRLSSSHRQLWLVHPYNQSKDLTAWHLAAFVVAIKESTHHLMQKNPVSYFTLCFIFIWSVEEITSATGYAARMMDYWKETEVQEQWSQERFAPEIEFLRWACFD